MPEPLEPALARLRPLLGDPAVLVRAVAAGRRRGARPDVARAELRSVRLKPGPRIQVVTTEGRTPTTRNHAPGDEADRAVDALLAQPFGNWHVLTRDEVVQLRVTKSGEAQVHRSVRNRSGGRVHENPEAAAHDRPSQHLLDPADPLFAALGADAGKRRQVDAFLRQLLTVAPGAVERAASSASATRPLRVVDLGCGNAYLTFAAHSVLRRHLVDRPDLNGVQTLGVDLRPDVVARNTRIAAHLGLAGLEFAVGTIEEANSFDRRSDGRGDAEVDIVLALHACDTATDDALARAVAWRAPVVLAAPCCHHDVRRQLEAARRAGLTAPHPHAALVRSPILRERFVDVLTDTLRAQLMRLMGYAVEVVEFVDSRHTPRNALLRAEYRGGPVDPAVAAEYADLAAAWHVRPALAERLADRLPGRPADLPGGSAASAAAAS